MKRFLFLSVLLVQPLNAKQIVLDVPEEEMKIVEHDVLDAEEWLRAAWMGKVNKCRDRIIQRELELSIDNSETIPPGKDEIIKRYLNRPDVKLRKQREKDSN